MGTCASTPASSSSPPSSPSSASSASSSASSSILARTASPDKASKTASKKTKKATKKKKKKKKKKTKKHAHSPSSSHRTSGRLVARRKLVSLATSRLSSAKPQQQQQTSSPLSSGFVEKPYSSYRGYSDALSVKEVMALRRACARPASPRGAAGGGPAASYLNTTETDSDDDDLIVSGLQEDFNSTYAYLEGVNHWYSSVSVEGVEPVVVESDDESAEESPPTPPGRRSKSRSRSRPRRAGSKRTSPSPGRKSRSLSRKKKATKKKKKSPKKRGRTPRRLANAGSTPIATQRKKGTRKPIPMQSSKYSMYRPPAQKVAVNVVERCGDWVETYVHPWLAQITPPSAVEVVPFSLPRVSTQERMARELSLQMPPSPSLSPSATPSSTPPPPRYNRAASIDTTVLGFDITDMPDYNHEYQLLIESVPSSVVLAQQRSLQMVRLVGEFVEFVKRVSHIIIDELCVDVRMKKIPPADVGGIAGGKKFVVGNVLFKLPSNDRGIYGTEENAHKAAALEIKAQDAVVKSGVTGLHCPLSVLIYTRGHAVYAKALAPFNPKHSLVYGSPNAGDRANRVIKKSSEEAVALVDELADHLHLKEHDVEDGHGKRVSVRLGVDVEVHHSKRDGRFYMADLARLMPPIPPRIPGRAFPSDVFFRHFRPEFMQQHAPTMLSSDSFSSFGALDHEKHHADVALAFGFFHGAVIPMLATELAERRSNPYAIDLSDEVHRFGVNMRELGRLRAEVPRNKTILRHVMLVEMVCRVIKCRLRTWLRLTYTHTQAAELTLVTLHHVFAGVLLDDAEGGGTGGTSSRQRRVGGHFWENVVHADILLKYGVELRNLDKDLDALRHLVLPPIAQAISSCSTQPLLGSEPARHFFLTLLEQLSVKLPTDPNNPLQSMTSTLATRRPQSRTSRWMLSEDREEAELSEVMLTALHELRRDVLSSPDSPSVSFSDSFPSADPERQADLFLHVIGHPTETDFGFELGCKIKVARMRPFEGADEAEKDLLRLLQHRESGLNDPLSPALVSTLLSLLRVCKMKKNARGSFDKGLELLGRLEQIHTQRKEIPSFRREAGLFFAHFHCFEKAEELLTRDVDAKEGKFGPRHPSLCRPLVDLAEVLKHRGQLTRRVELLQRALKIHARAHQSKKGKKGEGQHAAVLALEADIRAALGEALGDVLDFEGKLAQMEYARTLHEMIHGRTNPAVASVLTKLGTAYGQAGRHAKRKTTLEHAVALCQQRLGERHPATIESLIALSMAYGDLTEYHKQEVALKSALEGAMDAYGLDHPVTVQIYNELGSAYGRQAKFELQVRTFELAVEIIEGMLSVMTGKEPATTSGGFGEGMEGDGEEGEGVTRIFNRRDSRQPASPKSGSVTDLDPELSFQGRELQRLKAIVLGNLGLAYLMTDRIHRSVDTLEDAFELKVLPSAFGPHHVETAITMINLGNAYGASGEPKKQYETLKIAIGVLESQPLIIANKRMLIAQALNNLAKACNGLFKYREMKVHVERALTIHEDLGKPNKVEYATALVNLGAYHGSQRETKLRRKCLTRALAILEEVYSTNLNHPLLQRVRSMLEDA